MTFAFGMHDLFKDVYEHNDDILKFALMEKEGNALVLDGAIDPNADPMEAEIRQRRNVVVAIGNRTVTNSFFMKVPEPKVGKNRFHLDLVTDGSMSEEVERLVKLGARVIDVRQVDAETYDNPNTWTV